MARSKTAILAVRIISDAKKATEGFDNLAAKLDGFESKSKKFAAWGTAATGAWTALAKTSFDAASDMQQSSGAVEAVFKGQADTIKNFAKDAAQNVGIATSEYQNFAAVLGSQLKNLGIDQSELTGTTKQLIEMGADLASMFGGTTKEAVEALSAALRGETDPVERYGISIKKADIKARLAAKGLGEMDDEAQKQAETQVLLELLTEQSADALGNFAREADTAAGQQQRASAAWQDAKAALGEQLLPVVTEAAKEAAKLAGVIGEHPDAFIALGIAIGTFTGLAWAASKATAVYRGVMLAVEGAMKAAAVAQWLLNVALNASPIGRVVGALVLLAGMFVLAWENSETFRKAVGWMVAKAVEGFDWIAEKVGDLIDWFKGAKDWLDDLGDDFGIMADLAVDAFEFIMTPVGGLIDMVADLIRWIRSIRWPSPPAWFDEMFAENFGVNFTGTPEDVFRFMAPPVLTMAATPELTAASTSLPPAGPLASNRLASPMTVDQSIHINVTADATSDPRSIAEAIQRVLKTDARIKGRTVAV